MAEIIVRAENITVDKGGRQLFGGLSFTFKKGQCWAITGPSGSGKTTLLQVLTGRQAASGKFDIAPNISISFVPQQHRFLNRSHTSDFYYQQRFNALDAEDVQTTAEAYPELFAENKEAQKLQSLFGLQALKNQSLLHLSNGENKRLQLAKAVLHKPGLLLLDAPFTGLDADARNMLAESLSALCAGGTTVVFTTASNRIASFVTHVLALQQNGQAMMYDALDFDVANQRVPTADAAFAKSLLPQHQSHDFSFAVRLKDINICYGEKQVLQNISWEVKKGERWSLSGPNGAGKSTLLSLITADNPQAYANELYLFDRKRGSGESIWDIKKNIGFVSPELHLYFDAATTVFDAVASGFFDTIGLFRLLTDAQKRSMVQWLQLLQLQHQKNKLLSQLPLGQQRLVLLARALIKCPPLLVLDEPLQGLDETQALFFNNLLEAICAGTPQTLIYVSHYTDELPRCITHYLRLKNGREV